MNFFITYYISEMLVGGHHGTEEAIEYDFITFSERLQKLGEDQSHLLKTLFKTNIVLRKELKREDCERVMQKYEILHGLSWKKIKKHDS
jgi:hypothetical protein